MCAESAPFPAPPPTLVTGGKREEMPLIGRHIEIRGVVQGVGFRPWVYQLAIGAGVHGRVRNDSSGVIIDAFGSDAAIGAFTEKLKTNAPPAARVRSVEWNAIPHETAQGFSIAASASAAERNVSIPPDLATCPDCLAEIFDPANRRSGYAFTNCTNCGPRYTIVRGVPYDRAQTTMFPFEMCRDCQREYDDPLDRRFHAQPNACPECGPRLVAATPKGRAIFADRPLSFAARGLRAQMIVAVKGLGGFQLACDATSSLAVARLRERKRREARPLAVMVESIEAAEAIALLTEAERDLLTSVERPIVLVERRPDAPLALEVAFDTPLVGLFLPCTPLHHLLLRECRVPLVMTSGNLSDEPMAITNDDAMDRLRDVADIFLFHDREIETRADDSVVRIIAGTPTVLRRGRGYVPRGIALQDGFAEPVLATGAQLKNAICIGAESEAFLGPHIGDLESVETLRSFEKSVQQMKSFVGVEPVLVAHDMHPEYFSTRYAQSLGAGVRTIAVQHHHAHVAAAMAEHGVTGRVIGVAYDGTGYGTDGTSWGSEILIASLAGFERFATFRPVPLAGGDQAIRQVWRIALALIDEAFDGKAPLPSIPLFREMDRKAIEAVRRMVEQKFNSPPARGMGRYFDALGALGLGRAISRYEGEVATLWNMAADPHEQGLYEIVIREGTTPWEIDPRPMVRNAVIDLLDGVPAPIVSARFHNTIAGVTAQVVLAAAATHGRLPVVLTGGCFQNALLAERVAGALASQQVLLHQNVPPGDGGLALGQAVVADAIARVSCAVSEMASQEVPECV